MGSTISKAVKPPPKLPSAKPTRKYPTRSPPPPPRRPAAEKGWLHAESQSDTSNRTARTYIHYAVPIGILRMSSSRPLKSYYMHKFSS